MSQKHQKLVTATDPHKSQKGKHSRVPNPQGPRMLFMSVFIVTAETVQRHYIPRTLPGSPNPPTRTLPTCSARRRRGRSCAAWGRRYFAPLSLPKPAAAPRRRIPISTPLTVFPPTTHTPLLFLKAACSVKRHARGGAQYAPRVERAVQAPRRVRAVPGIDEGLIRRHSKLELEEPNCENPARAGVPVVRERADQ